MAAFPLTRHTRPGGDGRPIRRSDLQSLRIFRRSGMYADVARKLGLNEMVAMSLQPGGVHVCISLNRGGPGPEWDGLDRAAASGAQPGRGGPDRRGDRRRLGCSPRTVDKHLEHVYRLLGVSCRTAAIAARRTGRTSRAGQSGRAG